PHDSQPATPVVPSPCPPRLSSDLYDGGRSWFTGMGHASSAFTDEPLFVQHLLGGIQWAAGVVDGDCAASANENFEKMQLDGNTRSEEHTSELQSRENLVCRLLLEQ